MTNAMQKITKPAYMKYVSSKTETLLRLLDAVTLSSVKLQRNEESNPVLWETSGVVQLSVSHDPTGNICTLHLAVQGPCTLR